MKLGTRSVLWGVHQFVIHPLVVALAWRACYRHWPLRWQWAAIIAHDWGYWGKRDIDGAEGVQHPETGARWAGWLAYRLSRVVQSCRPAGILVALLVEFRHRAQRSERRKTLKAMRIALAVNEAFQAYYLALYHSTRYAAQDGAPPSALCLPDKVSVLFEPAWTYLLRGRLSGELQEYVEASPMKGCSDSEWLCWYRSMRRQQLTDHFLSTQ